MITLDESLSDPAFGTMSGELERRRIRIAEMRALLNSMARAILAENSEPRIRLVNNTASIITSDEDTTSITSD